MKIKPTDKVMSFYIIRNTSTGRYCTSAKSLKWESTWKGAMPLGFGSQKNPPKLFTSREEALNQVERYRRSYVENQEAEIEICGDWDLEGAQEHKDKIDRFLNIEFAVEHSKVDMS